LSRIYKMLRSFVGDTYRPKVIASYEDGYTVLTTSDDVGLMCYRYKNEPHISFTFDLDEVAEIIGTKKKYELVISMIHMYHSIEVIRRLAVLVLASLMQMT